MPTTTIGRFFLAKRDAIVTDRNAEGAFRLTLRVFDRQGANKVEPYVVTWAGPAAAAWLQENRSMQPGTVLDLELVNPRTFPGRISPEIHATIARCARAPSSNHDAETAHQQPAARAA